MKADFRKYFFSKGVVNLCSCLLSKVIQCETVKNIYEMYRLLLMLVKLINHLVYCLFPVIISLASV